MRRLCKMVPQGAQVRSVSGKYLTVVALLLSMEDMMEGSNLRAKRPTKLILLIAGAVVVLGLAGAAGFFFWQYTNLKNNPNAVAQETTQRLVGKVGQLYALPGDEQPTIAQVQDKEKLKEQAFFSRAENGDYILIYTNAKLALLYREKDNKLMNVGPITISEQQPKDQPAPDQGTDKPDEESER